MIRRDRSTWSRRNFDRCWSVKTSEATDLAHARCYLVETSAAVMKENCLCTCTIKFVLSNKYKTYLIYIVKPPSEDRLKKNLIVHNYYSRRDIFSRQNQYRVIKTLNLDYLTCAAAAAAAAAAACHNLSTDAIDVDPLWTQLHKHHGLPTRTKTTRWHTGCHTGRHTWGHTYRNTSGHSTSHIRHSWWHPKSKRHTLKKYVV